MTECVRPLHSRALTRRSFLASAAAGGSAICFGGCGGSALPGTPELVWGLQGITEGRLQRPRAMTIDEDDLLYIVDITGRIQVFDTDGNYLRGWRTPESKNGRPTGLSVIDGKLYVPDTHYYRVLVYTLDGKLLEDEGFGQQGDRPGDLGWVTDVVIDSKGNLYVSEYNDHDRIQKFARSGEFLLQWGTHGPGPGQFLRPQSMWIDADDRLWVCDAGNHRVQVFDTEGKYLFEWGSGGLDGMELGEFSYPYGISMNQKGEVYVCEFGNSRVQKFSPKGQPLASWGSAGRAPGQLHNPWAVLHDSRQRTYVLDTYNHRVQRILM